MVEGSRQIVLHVSDVAGTSDGIVAVLQAAGFEVRGAQLPDQGLADRVADVDLVILDTHVDGAVRLEFVRAIKRASHTIAPTLLGLSTISAKASDPETVDIEAQCDALLRKPVEAAELVVTIRRLMKIRRAELDLQKRERFLLTLLESGSDVITVLDADSTIRYASPAVQRILGYTADELLGRKAFELIHREDLPRIQEAFRVGIDMPDASAPMQFRFRHRNGRWRLLDGVGRNLLHDSVLHGIVVQSRDITDRAIVDRALRNSEERYRRLLHTAHEGILLLDAELKIAYANERVATMLGVSPDELAGASMLDFLDERRKAEARYYLERRRQGVPEQHDFTLLRRDGTELWVIVCASPTFDEQGVFTGVLAMLTDITERRKAERLTEESEQKFRLLFASNPQPMWVYDAETLEFLEVNDAAVARYEYSREELLQMRATDIASPEEIADVPRRADGLAGPVLPHGPWRHRSKTGSLEVETVRLSLAFAGRPGVLVVVNDVTERQRLEEQLRHSQRIEAVGKLAGGVAHDFNNLLTVITGRSRFLLRQIPEGDARRRDVELITSTVDRAAELTRQLLAFSRRQVLEPEQLDLEAVVRAMTLLLRRVIGEDIELVVKAESDRPAVRADRGQLEQIIVNLAVNARDAMPQGGRLALEIADAVVDDAFARRTPDAAAGRYVTLAVRDTGQGMSEQVRSRVFEPFFTTKEQGKGTGLGLATVYGIVRQHQGFITVESPVDAGSVFTVYLPAADAPDVVIDEAQPAAPSADIAHGSEAVLVVEDDESVRQLVGEILRAQGYQVLEAREPAEGMIVAEQHPGDLHLLITDVVMPKTSGRTLADVLTIRRPNLKVLYMSGYTGDAIAHHGVLEPGTSLLPKPFTPETLLKHVRATLSGHPSAVAAPTPTERVAPPQTSDRLSLPLERGVRIVEGNDAGAGALDEVDRLLEAAEGSRWKRFDAAPPIDAPQAPVTGVMPEQLRRQQRSRGLVLIVDDDPDVSSLLARDLEEAGFGVTTVDDGEKALTAVIKEEPDVVLLDLGMPRLNGIETLGALRAIAPMLHVIIVSGAGTPQDAARARAFCAFDYVPKPFDSGYLVSRVEAALHADFEGTER